MEAFQKRSFYFSSFALQLQLGFFCKKKMKCTQEKKTDSHSEKNRSKKRMYLCVYHKPDKKRHLTRFFWKIDNSPTTLNLNNRKTTSLTWKWNRFSWSSFNFELISCIVWYLKILAIIEMKARLFLQNVGLKMLTWNTMKSNLLYTTKIKSWFQIKY